MPLGGTCSSKRGRSASRHRSAARKASNERVCAVTRPNNSFKPKPLRGAVCNSRCQSEDQFISCRMRSLSPSQASEQANLRKGRSKALSVGAYQSKVPCLNLFQNLGHQLSSTLV